MGHAADAELDLYFSEGAQSDAWCADDRASQTQLVPAWAPIHELRIQFCLDFSTGEELRIQSHADATAANAAPAPSRSDRPLRKFCMVVPGRRSPAHVAYITARTREGKARNKVAERK